MKKAGALVTFTAALADGRSCLSLDREGEGRLTLILSQPEAAKVANAWPELVDRSFMVALQPFEE